MSEDWTSSLGHVEIKSTSGGPNGAKLTSSTEHGGGEREEVHDMTRAHLTPLAVLLSLALAATPCAAQTWAPGGVHLCQSGCSGDIPRIVSDAVGGAYVAWRDGRNSQDVFLQRVTGSGLIAAGWPPDGLPIAVLPSVQQFSGLAPDAMGGALVTWEDWRNLPGNGRDAYVQRVLANGSLAPGWPLNGNPASLDPSDQFLPEVAPAGSGGAFLVWRDSRNFAATSYDVYAQRLTASGAEAPGWPVGGLALCSLPGNQGFSSSIIPDGAGGAVFRWGDGRPGAAGGYAQRIHADGTIAAGWPANGLFLASNGVEAAARDEAGGFYVVSPTPGPSSGFDGAIYVLRFTFDGAAAPGWPAGGVLVCNAPGDRAGLSVDADGVGGLLLSWYDYRPPYNLTGGEIFAVRVAPNGTFAPGWAVNGTLVSDPTDAMYTYAPFIVRDDLGGAYVAWQSQGGNEFPSMVAHLTAGGQPAAGWPQFGLRVAPSHGQFDTRIAADGQGGAIVAWDETCCGRNGVWAQRYAPDGPTPVLLSLVGAEVTDGRVRLDWFSAAGASLSAFVERRTASSSWQSLGTLSADGTGHLRYEDRSVAPGERYAYRLSYVQGGVEQFSAETWVEVPALKLALEGLRPNPAVGELTASFTLPNGAPARLQLLDVTGRVWLAREVGAMGAGNHLIRLTEGAAVPAGIYWLRLSQSGRSLLARGVVIR